MTARDKNGRKADSPLLEPVRTQLANPEAAASGGPSGPIKDTMKKPLARRFYRRAEASADAPFAILLDGRTVKTPAKQLLTLPTRASAAAVAEEWAAQKDVIDPTLMPLTRFANSAIDAVSPARKAVVADIVAYAGRDLLCYRAEAPGELVAAQSAAWDPVLAWLDTALGARMRVAKGIMPIEQAPGSLSAIAAAVAAYDAYALTALHVMTTMTGSAALALAVARGQLSPAEAWKAAHVDEDYQVSQWGQDAEASQRRANRWQEFQAACRLLSLLSAALATSGDRK